MFQANQINNNKNTSIELARKQVKEDLIEVIIANNLQKPRNFSQTQGGEFVCPACGKTLKAYRNPSHEWAINPLGHCADFGEGGYSVDTFGLVACLTLDNEKNVFKRLLSEKGVFISSDNKNASMRDLCTAETKTRLLNTYKEREERLKQETERREKTKNENCINLINCTRWSESMPAVAIDLLFKRGIDCLALPRDIFKSVGYTKNCKLKSLDKDSYYTIDGIVFKLGEKGAQVRRTNNNTYVGKESKQARFQTFGNASPFALEHVKKELDKMTIEQQKKQALFITEGLFDTLSLYQAGVNLAVGALGVGNHQYLLNEFKDFRGVVFICFDTDSAGKSSGITLLNEFKKEGVNAFILKLAGQEHDINDNLQINPTSLYLRLDIIQTLLKLNKKDRVEKTVAIISSADVIKSDKFLINLLRELKLETQLNLS